MPTQNLQDGAVIRLPGVTHVSGPARRPQGLRDLPLPAGRLDDLLFLMNELAPNGFFLVSDRSSVNIEVRVLPETVRVEVHSGSEKATPMADTRPTASPGWGAGLAQRVCDRWGSEEGASRVWFEIDRVPPLATST